MRSKAGVPEHAGYADDVRTDETNQPASLRDDNMKPHVKPCGVKPQGEPFCVRPETDWVWVWTVADCVRHFGWVPGLFHVLDPTPTVAAVWHHLLPPWQSRLDHEFVLYDIEHHV